MSGSLAGNSLRKNQPVRLGTVGFAQPGTNPMFAAPKLDHTPATVLKKKGGIGRWFIGLFIILGLVGLGVGVLGVLEVVSIIPEDEDSEVKGEGDDQDTVDSPPTTSGVTNFPTPFATPRPTNFPTLFPTSSPSFRPTTEAEVTSNPSFSPSRAPTLSPVRDCETPDAECGCNQVRSTLVDIIFMLDVSGSVADEDFVTMKDAIKDFAEVNMPEGTRIGYVEFNSEVRKQFDLAEFDNAASLSESLDENPTTDGQTAQRAALQAAREMLSSESGAPREDASLALLMVTDGNPIPCDPTGSLCGCTGNGCECCDAAIDETGGANTLAVFKDEFDFDFFFLPVNPFGGGVVNIGLFDSAGLSEDRFHLFEIGNFEEFGELLQGDDLVIPLGPCVEAPTVSGGDRILQWEAMNELNEGFFEP